MSNDMVCRAGSLAKSDSVAEHVGSAVVREKRRERMMVVIR